MKKILLVLFLVGFIGYLYNLWLKSSQIQEKKEELLTQEQQENQKPENEKKEIWKEKIKKQENNEETKKQNKEDLYDLDKITYEKKLIWTEENWVFFWVPEGPLWGQILDAGKWKVTYSKLTELTIEKKEFDKEQVSNPENIWNKEWSWYLNENFDSYVYWNSLRNIDNNNKEWWVSFYILEKNGDKIIYEKLYFDFNHSLVWTLKIKEFDINKDEDISKQMLELNKSLKEQNKDFEIVKKTDFLFKEIIR